MSKRSILSWNVCLQLHLPWTNCRLMLLLIQASKQQHVGHAVAPVPQALTVPDKHWLHLYSVVRTWTASMWSCAFSPSSSSDHVQRPAARGWAAQEVHGNVCQQYGMVTRYLTVLIACTHIQLWG